MEFNHMEVRKTTIGTFATTSQTRKPFQPSPFGPANKVNRRANYAGLRAQEAESRRQRMAGMEASAADVALCAETEFWEAKFRQDHGMVE